VALTEDQRAMLRLLAQREQGYEDIAALMGLSVEEVRVKVREALAEVGESGQAPPEATERPEPTAEEPQPPSAPAEEPQPPPTVTAKKIKVEKPLEETPVAPPPKPSSTSASRPARIHLPADQRLLAGGLAGAVAVILVLVLVLSGGGSSSSPTTTSASSRALGSSKATNTTPTNSSLTGAVLKPVDGGNAKGLALFGRIKNKVALEVEAQDLEPSATGESYAIWLARSPTSMVPIASTEVGKSGRIAAEYQVPNEVLVFLASGAFDELAVTRVANDQFKSAVAKAKGEKKTPAYTGTGVLRGKVTGPIVGAAAKKQGNG
jgi:hypothetical protein